MCRRSGRVGEVRWSMGSVIFFRIRVLLFRCVFRMRWSIRAGM
nr:MAG TPA: hypothetical protein [Caudoviricetes sp.]